jgi:hypothetical protein
MYFEIAKRKKNEKMNIKIDEKMGEKLENSILRGISFKHPSETLPEISKRRSKIVHWSWILRIK